MEDWLHELSIDMFAEDGCLRVYGVGEDGVNRVPEANHRRRKGRWTSAALRPVHKVTLPNCAPEIAPSLMSDSRDKPLRMTMFPGAGLLARAR
jgi:hypothetical protein